MRSKNHILVHCTYDLFRIPRRRVIVTYIVLLHDSTHYYIPRGSDILQISSGVHRSLAFPNLQTSHPSKRKQLASWDHWSMTIVRQILNVSPFLSGSTHNQNSLDKQQRVQATVQGPNVSYSLLSKTSYVLSISSQVKMFLQSIVVAPGLIYWCSELRSLQPLSWIKKMNDEK